MFQQAYIFRGEEKTSRKKISIGYFGPADLYGKYFFSSEILHSLENETHLGRTPIWGLQDISGFQSCDFWVLEWPPASRTLGATLFPFSSRLKTFCPLFLEHRFDLDSENRYAKTSSLKNDIRHVEKENLTYSISEAPEDLRFFLKNLVEPYLKESHGFGAISLDSETLESEQIQALLSSAGLLRVFRGKDWVSGALLGISQDGRGNQIGRIKDVGVWKDRKNKDSLIELKAAWHFAVKHFQKMDLKEVSLMLTPPFLNNGVLRYKKKYRPRVSQFFNRGCWLIANPSSQKALEVLKSTPWICLNSENDLVATQILEDDANPVSSHKEFEKKNKLIGIAEYRSLLLEEL